MSYLETLRRIPDDIILAIAAHDFDETSGTRCVCGWAMRESIGRALGIDPASKQALNRLFSLPGSVPMLCGDRFAGNVDEWRDLYYGAASDTRDVETAFVDRLNEIVGTV